MERIINYIKEHTWIDVLLIVIVMIVFALLFGTHVFDLFTDRGREFLLPETILNGAVPYKDITLIYFPLAYYINALIYKVLGVSIYSLMTTQFFVCTFLIVGFYQVVFSAWSICSVSFYHIHLQCFTVLQEHGFVYFV